MASVHLWVGVRALVSVCFVSVWRPNEAHKFVDAHWDRVVAAHVELVVNEAASLVFPPPPAPPCSVRLTGRLKGIMFWPSGAGLRALGSQELPLAGASERLSYRGDGRLRKEGAAALLFPILTQSLLTLGPEMKTRANSQRARRR